AAATPASGPHTIAVGETEYKLTPADPSAKSGTVTIVARNNGKITHAIEVEGGGPGGNDAKSGSIAPGQSATLKVDLKPGKSYEWYCPFDVSHMGEIETRGPQALAFLQRTLSNDVRRIPEGGAQYAVLCRDDGGVLDDLFTYRLAGETFLTVTNAANHARDVAWLIEQAE